MIKPPIEHSLLTCCTLLSGGNSFSFSIEDKVRNTFITKEEYSKFQATPELMLSGLLFHHRMKVIQV
jgi:hypothetical protein